MTDDLNSYEARRDMVSGDPTLYCVDKRDPRNRQFMSACEIKGSQPYVDASIRKVPGAPLAFLKQEGKTEWATVDYPLVGKVDVPNHMGFRNSIFPFSFSFRAAGRLILRALGFRH